MPSQDQKPGPTEGIARVETRQNARGQRITVFIPLDGQGSKAFQGEAVLHAASPQGRVSTPIAFPIEANTIQEAFQAFDAARKELLRKMNKPKIQVAHLAPSPGNGGNRLG